MSNVPQVRQAISQNLQPDLQAVASVPTKSKEIPSAWRAIRIVKGAWELRNYRENNRQSKIVATTHAHLQEKISGIATKIATLQFPNDITKRDEYRTLFDKEMAATQPGFQEIEQGLSLLTGREDPKKVETLIAECKGMRQTIEARRKEMEAHFLLQAQREHIHALAKELSVMIDLIQKAAPDDKKDSLNRAAQSAKYYQTIDNNGMLDQKAGVAGFKKLIAEVAESQTAIFPQGEGVPLEVRRMNLNLPMEAVKLDQPELLIAELQKKASEMSIEQAKQLIQTNLPGLVKSALAFKRVNWAFRNIFYLNERLSKAETEFLKSMTTADLSMLPPQTVATSTEKALTLLKKGLTEPVSSVDGEKIRNIILARIEPFNRPLKVLSDTRQALKAQAPVESFKAPEGHALFQAALQTAQAPVAQTPAPTNGGEATARAGATQIVDQNTVRKALAVDFSKLVDQAFEAKTALGRGILQGKLNSSERDGLQASKARAESLATDPKFKTFVQNALDLIDHGFLREVPPFKTTPKPEALATSMKALRTALKQLP